MATLKTTIRTPSVVRTIVRGMGRPGESGAATPIAARSLLGNATNATALPVGISDPAVLQSIVQCPSESEFDSFVSLVGASFSAVDAALAARVLNTDGRLADAREWIASTISQAEAEAGTATTRRAFTAQRVRQAIVGWWTEEGFGERLGVVYDIPNAQVALECADSEWNFFDATTRDNLRTALNAAAATHTHNASAINAGTLDDARLSANIPRMVGGVIQASNLPSYVDDILEFANLASFPATGETGKIYVSLATNLTYRWSGSAYVELTDATAVWGQITGTLSNQTDLQNALNAKQDTLVSGTNIRTVNGNSLLGSGNVVISGGIGGSTGATDNAVLRADGTGGATAQSSSVTIDDSGNVTATQYIVGGTGSASAPLVFLNGAGTGNAIGLYRSGFDCIVAAQGVPVLRASYSAGIITVRDNHFGVTSAQFDAATVGADTRWSRSSAGVWRAGTTANNALGSVELANLTASALIGLGAYTVATLPSASANAGRIAQVTDSSVTANGSAVSGGGSNRVMVFSNGTTWDVVVA